MAAKYKKISLVLKPETIDKMNALAAKKETSLSYVARALLGPGTDYLMKEWEVI